MQDYDALLDAYLAGDSDAPIDPENTDPPVLDGLDDLDRILFRQRIIERDVERITETAERRIAEMRAWADDLLAGLRRDHAWLGHSAEAFAAKHFADQPEKVRTVKVPNGEIRRRPQKARVLDVDDATAAVIHALVPDLAPNGKPKISKTAVAERCEPGDVIGDGTPDEEGYVPKQAVLVTANDDGEKILTPVPGVVFMVPTRDKITAVTK